MNPSEPPQGIEYLKQAAHKLLQERREQNLLRCLQSARHSSDEDKEKFKASHRERWHIQARLSAHHLLQKEEIPQTWNFNLNDYLGLERSGVFRQHDARLASELPLGGLSSRLIGGDHIALQLLEEIFVTLSHCPSALYFHSGTSLNHTLPNLIEMLAAPHHLQFFSDELNHASTVGGITSTSLSKDRRHVFPHLDFKTLTRLLHGPDKAPVQVVFLEALYSMDGDRLCSQHLKNLLQNKRVVVVVDEAHSLGIQGAGGYGWSSLLADHSALIGVYPCGKALAAQGAFLAAPIFLRQIAINFARSWIYSTAPSPLIAAALATRLLALPYLDELRQRLGEISTNLAHRLQAVGYEVRGAGSPLLTLILSQTQQALLLEEDLKEQGIDVKALRYPTVPHGAPRLRLSLHPFLTRSHIHSLSQIMGRCLARRAASAS